MFSEVTNMSFDEESPRPAPLDIPLDNFSSKEDKAAKATSPDKKIIVQVSKEKFLMKSMWLSRFLVSPTILPSFVFLTLQ
jgi:hypothetical protein